MDRIFAPLLASENRVTGFSMQTDWDEVHDDITTWIRRAARAGKTLVIANDEQGPAGDGVLADAGVVGGWSTPEQQHQMVAETLWGGLMAGGAGTEAYFGGNSGGKCGDLTCDNWRTRDTWWDFARIAVTFFRSIPFHQMAGHDELVDTADAFCFARLNEEYVVFHKGRVTSSTSIDLQNAAGLFHVRWYDALYGGAMASGTVGTVVGGQRQTHYGAPPTRQGRYWAARLMREQEPSAAPTAAPTAPSAVPTAGPTAPSVAPTAGPTPVPSRTPTPAPTRGGTFERLQPRGCCVASSGNSNAVTESVASASSICRARCAAAASCRGYGYFGGEDRCFLHTALPTSTTTSGDSRCANTRCFAFSPAPTQPPTSPPPSVAPPTRSPILVTQAPVSTPPTTLPPTNPPTTSPPTNPATDPPTTSEPSSAPSTEPPTQSDETFSPTMRPTTSVPTQTPTNPPTNPPTDPPTTLPQ